MSEARILPFRRPQSATIAEARSGRFMIVSDIETLDDQLEELPDDVVAFAFRRMVREFRLGRALDDAEAAYRLHKHASTVQRLRHQYAEFLSLMDRASGHARHKFLTRKSAKSSNFRRPKPQQNCQTAQPEEDSLTGVSLKDTPDKGDKSTPVAARSAEGSAPLPAQKEPLPKLRAESATPNPTHPPDNWPATPEDLAAAEAKFPDEAALAGFMIRVSDHCHAHRIPLTPCEYRFRLEYGWPGECDAA